MEEKEKLYDSILTTGARWLAIRENTFPSLDGFGLKDIKLNSNTYIFLSIAQIYTTYTGKFYFKGNIFKYLYLKYIKKFKFLSRVNDNIVDYIDVNIFLSELVSAFNEKLPIIEEIYKHYYIGR